jgi:hypothetical protein
MQYNSDYKHDLRVGQEKERELGKILKGEFTVEVKHDRYDNERFFIEYMYDDGEKSYKTGISTTKADYYALSKPNYIVFILTEKLKAIVRRFAKYNQPISGGDSNRYKGFLISLHDIIGAKTEDK